MNVDTPKGGGVARGHFRSGRSGCSQASGETVMSMEMWWRSAAIEALQGFVLGAVRTASRSDAAKLHKSVVALLKPVLDAILVSPALQVRCTGVCILVLWLQWSIPTEGIWSCFLMQGLTICCGVLKLGWRN